MSSTVKRAASVAFCVATAPPVKSLIERPTWSVDAVCVAAELAMVWANSADR